MTKRFYKNVEVREDGRNFKIFCDDRSLKNAGKGDFVVPTRELAEEIAKEWDAQADEIKMESMPITNFVGAVLALDSERRAKLKADMLSFVSTDVLCYRASYPESLVKRQAKEWNPVLDWLETAFGIRLVVVAGVLPSSQPRVVEDKIKAEIDKFDDFQLLGFCKIASVCTSISLGLAVLKKFVEADKAFELSRLEENYQNEQWGTDMEALKARNLALAEAVNAEKVLKLVGCL